MTALDFARWQGGVAGLLLGALAGALMEEAGLAGNAAAAVVLALIGGLLGYRAGERLHRRRLRRQAERLAGQTASPPGRAAGVSTAEDDGSPEEAGMVEGLEAVLTDLDGLRDDAAPSHGRTVAAVVERATSLTAIFDLLSREGRLILEPGISTPVDAALASGVAVRFERFCDRAALDGISPGPAMADYVAAAVRRRVVELDPFRVRPEMAGGAPAAPDADAAAAGEAGAAAGREALHGGGVEAATLRMLLVLMVQVEAVRRTADRTTRDPRALTALADLKRVATAGTARLLGRPSPWYVRRWFPTLAAD